MTTNISNKELKTVDITISEFLKAFGYAIDDKVEFVAWDKQNYRNNRRASLNLRPSAIDILKKWSNGGTVNIGFVPNGGRKDEDVEECNVVFCEFDDGSSLDEQLTKLQKNYLPKPSIIVSSGNRSFHFYWLLTDNIETEEFTKFQYDLAVTVGSDTAICNPARTMRLPFFRHPKTGNRAQVIEFNCTKHQFRFMRKVIGNYYQTHKAVKETNYKTKTQPIFEYIDLLEDAEINKRRNVLESRCPAHKGESKSVFYVDLSTGAFKCCAGCSGKKVLDSLKQLKG